MIRKQAPMCKSRGSASASNPQPRLTNRTSASRSRSSSTALPTSSSSGPAAATSTSFTGGTNSTASSASRASLTSLRESLPENPTLYPFLEISSATNHFLAPRLATSSSSWRCSLRGRDVVVVQGPFLSGDHSSLLTRLSALSRAHHSAIIPLLGASLAPPHLYLVYEFAPGAPLSLLLRNPRNPSFTTLSSWSSRVKIAADLAQGLDYIHNHSAATGIRGGPVHNRIKSSSIIVSEPDLRARICHFGAVVLSGQILNEAEEISPSPSANISRTDSRRMRIEGTRGYMAPEVMSGSRISQSSDVYAFGVVLLELLSGEEPLKYKIQKATRDFERISLIGTAREVIGDGDEEAVAEMTEHREGRLRRWVDGRLRDSFPVGAAERLVRVALRCVEEAPAARPGMEWVAGRVSKVLVESKAWEGRIRPPTDFSVSMAPR